MFDENKKIYRSRDEAYPFLSERPESLICDFEILTDEIASMAGLLAAKAPEEFREEILKTEELVYHLNPAIRTFLSLTEEEYAWLEGRYRAYRKEFEQVRFVLPAGTEAACMAHLIRVKCKELARLMYRIAYAGGQVPERAFDFAGLLSNYFFYLALKINQSQALGEREFISRNYAVE